MNKIICGFGIYNVFFSDRLGRLDALSSLKDDNPPLIRYADSFLTYSRYIPPDVAKHSISVLRSIPGHALDAWGFASVIYEVFNSDFNKPDDLNDPKAIPSNMVSLYQALKSMNPKSRISFEQFIASGKSSIAIFNNDFIWTSLFLEEWALKDASEKEAFLMLV